jgi:hypothetical protein
VKAYSDPLAEKYTSMTGYHYALNNPVRFLGLFGMDSSDPNTVRKEKQANREARKAETDADVTHRANKTDNNCLTCPQKSNYVGRTFVSEGKTYTYTDEAWKQSLAEVVIIREQLAYRKAWMYAVLGELGSGKVNLDESTNPYIWTSGEINAAMDVQLTIALTVIPIPAVGGLRSVGLGGKWIGSATTKGLTVVGEGMARVEAAASKIPGAKILNDMPKFTGTADQITSQIMTYNRQWILQQMRSGRPILDIGRDLNRSNPSIFYHMEQSMMKNYLKLHSNAFQTIKP